MNKRSKLRRLAQALRRVPKLVYIAARLYRVFQPKFSIGVVGVIFDASGRILLVEHVFHPREPWGLPGGWLAGKESPAQTVERELQEELQLQVEIGPLLLAEVSYPGHLDIAYLCIAKNGVGRLSRELLDFGWYDPHALPRVQQFHFRAITRALEFVEVTTQV